MKGYGPPRRLGAALLLILLALAQLSCSEKSPAAKVRDQVLELLSEGGLLARAEQGSVIWTFGREGPVRVDYDPASGGEPFIPFPLVVDGERLYLSGDLLDGAEPGSWILLTPALAGDIWRDESFSVEERQLGQTILAFVRYGNPRTILASLDADTARIESSGGITRLTGSAQAETLLGDEVPAEVRDLLHDTLAFPPTLEVVLEVDDEGRPVRLMAGSAASDGIRQSYVWAPGPETVRVPEEDGDFEDWLLHR